MIYIIDLILKAQINLIRFLKIIKMSKILCVATFDIIRTFSKNTIWVNAGCNIFVYLLG